MTTKKNEMTTSVREQMQIRDSRRLRTKLLQLLCLEQTVIDLRAIDPTRQQLRGAPMCVGRDIGILKASRIGANGGVKIGAKVTLRSDKMYEFIDRLFNLALPRVRDFKGINPDSFDGRGNYSLGLKEQLIFPEIEYDKIEKIRGMDIVFVTSAKVDEEARELLKLLGAPFAK